MKIASTVVSSALSFLRVAAAAANSVLACLIVLVSYLYLHEALYIFIYILFISRYSLLPCRMTIIIITSKTILQLPPSLSLALLTTSCSCIIYIYYIMIYK